MTESRRMVDKLKWLRSDLNLLKMRAAEDDASKREMNELLFDLEEKFSVVEDKLLSGERDSEVERAWEDAARAVDGAKIKYLH